MFRVLLCLYEDLFVLLDDLGLALPNTGGKDYQSYSFIVVMCGC